jgi:hypothetical protein
MGSIKTMFSLAVLCLAGALAIIQTPATLSAQDVEQGADHTLSGAWLIDFGDEGGRLLTFAADGTALFTDVDGMTGHGSWTATDSSSLTFTVVQTTADQTEEGPYFTGYFVISGDIRADSENSWIGDLQVAQSDRSGIFQAVDGPFTLSATRLPVLSFDDLAAGLPLVDNQTQATPEA